MQVRTRRILGRGAVVPRLRAAVVLAAFLSVVPWAEPAVARDPAWGTRGMVASSVGPAVEAGREILGRGGNAIDAAVATAFAAGVAHPFSSGVGGGGFAVVHLGETGETVALDAREVAPAAAHRDLFLGPDGVPSRTLSRVGGLAVAVPSLVAGLYELHARYGTLPWRELLEPAIRLAIEGVEIGPHPHRIMSHVAKDLPRFRETARIFLVDGEIPPLGHSLRQRELANTLQAIAEHGAEALRDGPYARAIVDAVRAEGGVLSLRDLASYTPVWRAPVRGTYRGHVVWSMPPPSSGGVHLVQMLNTLEAFDLRTLGPGSSDAIHILAEAMKLAYADRAVHMGDPAFHDVPVQWLTSKRYGRELAARILPPASPRWPWSRSPVLRVERPGTPPPRDDTGTTHISVMDARGNAVSLTQTINTLFGSLVTVAGTGIVLNNEMDDFAIAPNAPNAWGLLGNRANEVAPGKRPLSSMTPTIVLRDDAPWIVAGSPMGPMIITAVLQAILGVVDFGMDVQTAVAAPRIHHQWQPDVLVVEPAHPRDVVERLRALGHPVEIRSMPIGAATLVVRDPETGILWGSEDPRRATAAAGY